MLLAGSRRAQEVPDLVKGPAEPDPALQADPIRRSEPCTAGTLRDGRRILEQAT